MENLSEIVKKFGMLIILLVIFQMGYAQGDYFVYRVEGEPYLEVNDSIKSVNRGSVLDQNTILTLARNDRIQFINKSGDLYELYQTGRFDHSALTKIQPVSFNTSFTKNMLTYLWKEFTNTVALRNNKSGVVYRGDLLILKEYPLDSVSIYNGEIRFEWQPIKDKEKDYYLLIREKGSDLVTTIGTPGLSLTLLVDDILLKPGTDYEWTVTESKVPNLKKTSFYNFRLLTESEFQTREADIKKLQAFYKKLGLSRSEIRIAICNDYKICL